MFGHGEIKTKNWRSLLAATVLLFAISNTNAATIDVDMTQGTWEISALDNRGVDWGGSTINFNSQVADGDMWNLSGIFQWTSNRGSRGGERFNGTLGPDGELRLQGFELVDPVGIVLANYFAVLDDTGNRLLNGSWTDGVPSNDFSAVRVVPLPPAFLLFGSALFGLIGIAKRRRS